MANILNIAYRIVVLCVLIHEEWNSFATDTSVTMGERVIHDATPIVKTKLGAVAGQRIELIGRGVDVFWGIPYAEPPVGNLRLKKSVPVRPWSVTLQATRRPNQCRQNPDEWPPVPGKSSNCSEDCLYLNIWTPANIVPGELRPVMVWIHGGDFILGSSSWDYYDGAMLSAYGDVVIVSVNYRLGRLGFLNAGSEAAPGNQGLYDQNLALKWIKEHVDSFGGNASSVTVFGQDAGAASIAMHIMSPLSSGLFQRAILQSGSAFWRLRESSMWKGHVPLGSKAVTKPMNCTSSRAKKDFDELLSATNVDRRRRRKDVEDVYHIYGPTFDNEFLPLNQHMAFSMGLFNEVEVLIGSNKNEGAFEFRRQLQWKNFIDSEEFTSLNLLHYIKTFFNEYRFKRQLGAAATEGIYYYFASNLKGSDIVHNRQYVFDFVGDYLYVCPTVYFADALADHNTSVFYYRFNHGSVGPERPPWAAATHFDEVPYVFGRPIRHPEHYTTEEKELSVSMMDTWVSFAKAGKPASPSGQPWPRYSSEHGTFLDITAKGYLEQSGPSAESCNFWRTFHSFDIWKNTAPMFSTPDGLI
ncbi:cholinesterase 1-like [Ornithodoros turicata]|uniref:cholinesterase 1-like n=1 Tax=Ornithodoros turicata TaxID=34597 RepID=UPI003138FAD2